MSCSPITLISGEVPRSFKNPASPGSLCRSGTTGSPLETEQGWLLITHGVGSVRTYCLCATLLDLEEPSRVIGRLAEPILTPNGEEREGYVPNVVYSCGSYIHNGHLIIPYGMADYATAFGCVSLKELLEQITLS